jgi:threonine/homoserine/homoserine lactone efflux protein
MPVDPNLLLAYLIAAWVLILTPGPDMFFILGQTLAGGKQQGWAATAGVMAGAAIHILAAVSGTAALVLAHPALFEALRIAGAAYLLWLGVQSLRAAWRPAPAVAGDTAAPAPRLSARLAFRQGLLTNLLNPKVALFFLAFLPQFVDPGRAPVWVQMLLLGPLLPLMALGFFAVMIALAGSAARLLAAGKAGGGRLSRWMEGAAGLIFLGLGLRLLLGEGPRPR